MEKGRMAQYCGTPWDRLAGVVHCAHGQNNLGLRRFHSGMGDLYRARGFIAGVDVRKMARPGAGPAFLDRRPAFSGPGTRRFQDAQKFSGTKDRV